MSNVGQVSEFYCSSHECKFRGRTGTLPWRDCGNKECCKAGGTHYPQCGHCGKVMSEVVHAPSVIWTGNITRRYRDSTKEGYYGDATGEDGFWAWKRKTLSGKPEPVRLENWQDVSRHCKEEGLVDPRSMPSNAEVSDDGKKLMTSGMSGQEI